MTNISFFFPEAEKGKALGLNAAGGNLGTGIVAAGRCRPSSPSAPARTSSAPA